MKQWPHLGIEKKCDNLDLEINSDQDSPRAKHLSDILALRRTSAGLFYVKICPIIQICHF